MKDIVHFDRSHELHGKTVINTETLETLAANIVVHQSGLCSYENDLGDVTRNNDAAQMLAQIENTDSMSLIDTAEFNETAY